MLHLHLSYLRFCSGTQWTTILGTMPHKTYKNGCLLLMSSQTVSIHEVAQYVRKSHFALGYCDTTPQWVQSTNIDISNPIHVYFSHFFRGSITINEVKLVISSELKILLVVYGKS